MAINSIIKTKTCVHCQHTKPISEFSHLKSSPDGYNTRCKECSNKAVLKSGLNRFLLCSDEWRDDQLIDVLKEAVSQLRARGHTVEINIKKDFKL